VLVGAGQPSTDLDTLVRYAFKARFPSIVNALLEHAQISPVCASNILYNTVDLIRTDANDEAVELISAVFAVRKGTCVLLAYEKSTTHIYQLVTGWLLCHLVMGAPVKRLACTVFGPELLLWDSRGLSAHSILSKATPLLKLTPQDVEGVFLAIQALVRTSSLRDILAFYLAHLVPQRFPLGREWVLAYFYNAARHGSVRHLLHFFSAGHYPSQDQLRLLIAHMPNGSVAQRALAEGLDPE
jgi:hypothetical protein